MRRASVSSPNLASASHCQAPASPVAPTSRTMVTFPFTDASRPSSKRCPPASLAPGGRSSSDDVMLVRFKHPRTEKTHSRNRDHLLRELSSPLPMPYSAPPFPSHDCISVMFVNATGMDGGALIFVWLLGDPPPPPSPICRRKLSLHSVWDAFAAETVRSETARPVHHARDLRPHSSHRQIWASLTEVVPTSLAR